MRGAYALLVAITVTAHFLFLGYLTLGGFLTWRWPRTLWAHLAVAGWGVVSVTVGVTCPLTVLEAWARREAGEPALTSGFIDHYVTGVLYPRRYETLVQILVACCVAASWIGLYAHHRHASDAFKTAGRTRP